MRLGPFQTFQRKDADIQHQHSILYIFMLGIITAYVPQNTTSENVGGIGRERGEREKKRKERFQFP